LSCHSGEACGGRLTRTAAGTLARAAVGTIPRGPAFTATAWPLRGPDVNKTAIAALIAIEALTIVLIRVRPSVGE
jgi:hypothetical protein